MRLPIYLELILKLRQVHLIFPFYESSNQSPSQTNPETSSDTPPAVSAHEKSSPVTRLPAINPFVASGLISPDLADILATPAGDAAVV